MLYVSGQVALASRLGWIERHADKAVQGKPSRLRRQRTNSLLNIANNTKISWTVLSINPSPLSGTQAS